MNQRLGREVNLVAPITVVLLAEPVRSLAATTAGCSSTPVLPESPAGPVLLIASALAAIGFLAYRRHHRGLAAPIVSILTIVLVTGALLTHRPRRGGDEHVRRRRQSAGGVLAAQTDTPFTGADIPWIIAAFLVLAGTVVTAVARRRRRQQLTGCSPPGGGSLSLLDATGGDAAPARRPRRR